VQLKQLLFVLCVTIKFRKQAPGLGSFWGHVFRVAYFQMDLYNVGNLQYKINCVSLYLDGKKVK